MQWPTAGGANQECGQRAHISSKDRANLESAASGDAQPKACTKKDWGREPTSRGGTGKVGFPEQSLDDGLLL